MSKNLSKKENIQNDDLLFEQENEKIEKKEQVDEKIIEGNDLVSKADVIKELAKSIEQEVKNNKQETTNKKRPSLFVNDENIKIKITVLYSFETGDVLSIFAHTLPIEDKLKELMGVEELEFEFSKMSYDQLRGYREVCSYIDPNTKALQINSLKMRDCYVYYHLKGWNLKDEEGNDIEIKLEESGSLTEESREVFFKLTPAIIDIAINEFENKLNI